MSLEESRKRHHTVSRSVYNYARGRSNEALRAIAEFLRKLKARSI